MVSILCYVSNEIVIQQPTPHSILDNPEAIEQFAGYFELLNKIDQRLKKEDPDYKNKYYPKIKDERKYDK